MSCEVTTRSCEVAGWTVSQRLTRPPSCWYHRDHGLRPLSCEGSVAWSFPIVSSADWVLPGWSPAEQTGQSSAVLHVNTVTSSTDGRVKKNTTLPSILSSVVVKTFLTRKPSYRWQTRATRKPAKNCSNSTCLQRCRWQYWPIFMRLTAIASEIREIPRNSLKIQT